MNTTSVELSEWEYRNIALAVVMQCAELVHQLAQKGSAPPDRVSACLQPVYQLNSDSVATLYPQPGAFTEGMQILQNSFDSRGLREHAEVVRYMLGMLVIREHLQRNPRLQAEIAQGIQGLSQYAVPQFEDAQVQAECAQLARLYQDTISRLDYRIHVAGNPEYLRNQQVAEQIRALLLAGIRSAVLWHQLGGRRWQLFFYKRRIRDSLSNIRRKLISGDSYPR